MVIPVVFYTGKEKWNASLDLKDLIKAPRHVVEKCLYKPCLLVDTRRLPDEELVQQSGTGLIAYLLKHARYQDICSYIQPALALIQSLGEEEGSDHVEKSLEYAIIAGKISD